MNALSQTAQGKQCLRHCTALPVGDYKGERTTSLIQYQQVYIYLPGAYLYVQLKLIVSTSYLPALFQHGFCISPHE